MTLYDDLDILARTVYGEARGESDMGRLAVAYVACNRAEIAARYVASRERRHPLFGDGTVADACRVHSTMHRPDGRDVEVYQFSCWAEYDVNRAIILALDLTSDDAAPSVRMATAAIERSAPDPSNGATHYHATSVSPYWAVGETPCAEIGNHAFYRLV
jgi:N-acetylmuramoyl-L-alanine amidase